MKGKGTKGKGAKLELMNLDGSDNDANYDIGNNDEDGEEPISEQAMKHMKALKNILKSCQKCGPEVMCKIDIQGNHIKVSYNLLRSWVAALVGDI